MDRYLTRREVQALVPISTATLYQWMAAGNFPKAVRLGGRAGCIGGRVGWRERDVLAWQQSRREYGYEGQKEQPRKEVPAIDALEEAAKALAAIPHDSLTDPEQKRIRAVAFALFRLPNRTRI